MLPVLGLLVVFAAIVGGFAMENGKLAPLVEPAELVIICGSALGTMIAANPWPVLKEISKRILLVFRGPPYTPERYLATLLMLHSLFAYARRSGMSQLESDLDKPRASPLLKRHAALLADPEVEAFVCDTLLMTSLGAIPPSDLDTILENDIEIRRRRLAMQVDSLAALADALPGLGIVAAVLGVVLTMGTLHDSPAEIGFRVGRALVGTFLGIFLSYGVVAPLASNLEKIGEAEADYYESLRGGLTAFARGMPPSIAAECARRRIPSSLRPEFEELERALKIAVLHRAKAA